MIMYKSSQVFNHAVVQFPHVKFMTKQRQFPPNIIWGLCLTMIMQSVKDNMQVYTEEK